jgi:3-hydroxyisobutyrate dehydrogenase-like beta-hydroxyacid dehydrogenase
MSSAIGFIGLGLLGLPAATNLLDKGHSLRVYNRTASKIDPLVARGAVRAETPADACTPGGVVVSLLWDGASVLEVVNSPGFLDRLGPGGVHLAMSTILPETARTLAALHEAKGAIYLDAPVFGRPEAAVARKLSIALAGPKAAKERARPILEDLGGSGIFDFGEVVGSGVAVKLAGNFLILSATRSLGEALGFAGKNGVDQAAVLAMLTSTLFPSPIYQSYGQRILAGDAAFVSKIPEKDMGLFTQTAERIGSPAPVASKLYDLLKSQ